MADVDEWDMELIEDRGHCGAMITDFLNGPRFVVRHRGSEAGVVELKTGRVYLNTLSEAVGAPRGDTTRVYDLLDDAGAEEVRRALPLLKGELEPGRVTALFVDGAGIARLIDHAHQQ